MACKIAKNYINIYSKNRKKCFLIIGIFFNVSYYNLILLTVYSLLLNSVKLVCQKYSMHFSELVSLRFGALTIAQVSFRGIPDDGPVRERMRSAGSTKFNVVAGIHGTVSESGANNGFS